MTKPLTSVFTLSIELTSGEVSDYPFHLGTDIVVARTRGEEIFHSRPEIFTVAICRDNRIVDVRDALGWQSAYSEFYAS